ncbi:MAG: FecR domain-containing protein [Kiritimatiellae bacterium]|nr:FecR domain-containing protein [Kiritimatiellia bacterium]
MNAEFDNLVADYLDADPSPQVLARLAQLMRGELGLEDRFRAELRLHVLMRELAAEALAADVGTDRVRPRPRAARPAVLRPAVQPARAAWTWWVTGIAATVLIGLGLVFQARISRLSLVPAHEARLAASVQRVSGAVSLARGARSRPAAAGEALFDGDTLGTAGPDAVALVAFADGTRLECRATASARLDSVGRASAKRLYVAQGRLVADVTPQPPDRKMQVRTPHAEVLVLGTRFVLEVTAESTRVDMREGETRVICTHTGQSDVLRAGYVAAIGKSLAIAARPQFGEREQVGLAALYTFSEGAGLTARDSSRFGIPLNLSLQSEAPQRWIPGGGLAIVSNAKLVSPGPATKIIDACRASNELTLEAWVKPGSTKQGGDSLTGPARIVSISHSWDTRNVTLGQHAESLIVRLRTTNTDDNGLLPHVGGKIGTILEVQLGAQMAQRLHLAVTYSARTGQARLYVNGEPRAERRIGGELSNWEPTYRLSLAAEGDDQWKWWHGELYLVAFYNRALSADRIRAHYEAGPSAGAARLDALHQRLSDQDECFCAYPVEGRLPRRPLEPVALGRRGAGGSASSTPDGDRAGCALPFCVRYAARRPAMTAWPAGL